jgi:hypothetical protein
MNPLRRYPHRAHHPEINRRKSPQLDNRHNPLFKNISNFPAWNAL